MKYSLFYLRFRPGCWCWELVVMARKFSLALASDPRIGNTVIAFAFIRVGVPLALSALPGLAVLRQEHQFILACVRLLYVYGSVIDV